MRRCGCSHSDRNGPGGGGSRRHPRQGDGKGAERPVEDDPREGVVQLGRIDALAEEAFIPRAVALHREGDARSCTWIGGGETQVLQIGSVARIRQDHARRRSDEVRALSSGMARDQHVGDALGIPPGRGHGDVPADGGTRRTRPVQQPADLRQCELAMVEQRGQHVPVRVRVVFVIAQDGGALGVAGARGREGKRHLMCGPDVAATDPDRGPDETADRGCPPTYRGLRHVRRELAHHLAHRRDRWKRVVAGDQQLGDDRIRPHRAAVDQRSIVGRVDELETQRREGDVVDRIDQPQPLSSLRVVAHGPHIDRQRLGQGTGASYTPAHHLEEARQQLGVVRIGHEGVPWGPHARSVAPGHRM